jgi:hypothetical protein
LLDHLDANSINLMPTLTLDRSTLEKLLNHAASAAQLIGHLDEAIAAGSLGDHIDAIAHGLSELLGDPHPLAAPDDRAPDDRAPDDLVAHGLRADAHSMCRRCLVSRRPEPLPSRLAEPVPGRGHEPAANFDGLIYLLNDNIGRADAMITAVEDRIEQSWDGHEDEDEDEDGGEDGDSISRRRNHVMHLIESAKLAVRAAGYVGIELTAQQGKRQKGA